MTHEDTFVKTTCPVARAVDLLGDRWVLMILRDAFDGLRRFSDFQKSTGVAKNLLAVRLKWLVEAGIFTQVPVNEGAAYHAYALTPKGNSLFPVILSLRQWGEEHLFRDGEPMSRLVDAEQQPVAKLVVTNASGKKLEPEDILRLQP